MVRNERLDNSGAEPPPVFVNRSFRQVGRIHPTALISPAAAIADDVLIGPLSVVSVFDLDMAIQI